MATLRNLPARIKPTRLRIWDESRKPEPVKPAAVAGIPAGVQVLVEYLCSEHGEQEVKERLLLCGRYQWVANDIAFGRMA